MDEVIGIEHDGIPDTQVLAHIRDREALKTTGQTDEGHLVRRPEDDVVWNTRHGGDGDDLADRFGTRVLENPAAAPANAPRQNDRETSAAPKNGRRLVLASFDRVR